MVTLKQDLFMFKVSTEYQSIKIGRAVNPRSFIGEKVATKKTLTLFITSG